MQEQAQKEGGFEKKFSSEEVEAEKGGKRGNLKVDTDVGDSLKVEVVYPGGLITEDRVPRILHKLATEREAHHKKWMKLCVLGMPVTIPIGILPL